MFLHLLLYHHKVTKRPSLTVGLTKPPVHCVPPFFPGTRRPGCEVDLSPLNAEVQNDWRCNSVPPIMSLCRGQRYLCLYLSGVLPAVSCTVLLLSYSPFVILQECALFGFVFRLRVMCVMA